MEYFGIYQTQVGSDGFWASTVASRETWGPNEHWLWPLLHPSVWQGLGVGTDEAVGDHSMIRPIWIEKSLHRPILIQQLKLFKLRSNTMCSIVQVFQEFGLRIDFYNVV